MYDSNNIFAKIIAREIPCDFIHESEHSLAFNDIQARRKIHALVIPKGNYTDLSDFTANATEAQQLDFWQAVEAVVKKTKADKEGYRLIANTGKNAHQEVPHFHVHILAGEAIGPLVADK